MPPIQLKNYHDAKLESVDNTSKGVVRLKFRSENNEVKLLDLLGCKIFRLNDFIGQNIVSRILLYSGKNLDAEDVRRHLNWSTSLNDAPSYLSEENIEELIGKVVKSQLSLLYLEPSAGADFVAVFETMSESKLQ